MLPISLNRSKSNRTERTQEHPYATLSLAQRLERPYATLSLAQRLEHPYATLSLAPAQVEAQVQQPGAQVEAQTQ